MTALQHFAASQNIPESDVTHCVRIGTRGPHEVYALGWWTRWAYTTATATFDGEAFADLRVSYDMDVEREGVPA